jgi:hypothetical protein
MVNRRILTVGIAGMHLFFVAMSAGGFRATQRIARIYGALTGACASYGFFSPEVAGNISIIIDIEFGTLASLSINLESIGLAAQGKRRLNAISCTLLDPNEAIYRETSLSIASIIADRYPKATAIQVSFYYQVIDTVPQYRADSEERKLLYTTKYQVKQF